MKIIDYTKIYENKKYKGKFVVINKSHKGIKVIAVGENLDEILEEIKKKKIKRPIITRIPEKDKSLVFYCND